MSATDWSDVVMSELPTGTVTLAPIRLRIAVHAGEVQLRDEVERY